MTESALETTANVLTSLPFLAIGAEGLLRRRRDAGAFALSDAPQSVLLISLMAAGAGSAMYHLSPGPALLLWDRLPIAAALAAMACAVLNGYRRLLGTVLLLPFVLLAVASVVYWHATAAVNEGDLRPYAAVQIVTIGTMLCAAIMPPAALGKVNGLRFAVLAYATGRLLEYFDPQLRAALHFNFAHPLKHVMVAVGAMLLVRVLDELKDEWVEVPVEG